MHVRRSDIRQQTPPQPRVAEESQQPGSSRTSAAPPAPPTPYREAINRPDRFPKACGQTHSTRYHQSGASESGNPQNAFRPQWKTRNHFRIAAPNAHHTAPCIPHSPHTENHHRYPRQKVFHLIHIILHRLHQTILYRFDQNLTAYRKNSQISKEHDNDRCGSKPDRNLQADRQLLSNR